MPIGTTLWLPLIPKQPYSQNVCFPTPPAPAFTSFLCTHMVVLLCHGFETNRVGVKLSKCNNTYHCNNFSACTQWLRRSTRETPSISPQKQLSQQHHSVLLHAFLHSQHHMRFKHKYQHGHLHLAVVHLAVVHRLQLFTNNQICIPCTANLFFRAKWHDCDDT